MMEKVLSVTVFDSPLGLILECQSTGKGDLFQLAAIIRALASDIQERAEEAPAEVPLHRDN